MTDFRLLLTLLLFPVFGTLPAQTSPLAPLQQSARTSGTQNWQYSQYREYQWNDNSQAWDSTWQAFYTYSGGVQGPTGVVNQQYINGFQDASRYTYTYNTDGLLDGQFIEYWLGGQWVDAFEIIKTYDASGEMTSDLILEWNGTTWDTSSYIVVNLTYDAQNRLLERERLSRNVFTGQWLTIQKDVYTYGSGPAWETELVLAGTGTGWDSSYQVTSVNWKDFEKNQFYTQALDLWDNFQRRPHLQKSRTYGINDSYVEDQLSYNTATGNFDSLSHQIFDYNLMGDLAGMFITFYDTATATWDLYIHREFLITYDVNDNMIDWISNARYSAADPLSFEYRNEFIGYLLNIEESLQEKVSWASHPVGQSGRLVVNVEEMGMLSVEVLDLQGRILKVFVMPHPGGKQAHDIELGLPSGLYLYRVQLNGQSSSGRLQVK